MKVLWLCNIMLPKIAKCLSLEPSHYGGWLVGLSDDLLKCENIRLTVCFPTNNKKSILEGKVDNLNYYGFNQKFKNSKKENIEIENKFEYIIKKVNPDIIHIFGTEFSHTLNMINTCEKLGYIDKVVINIQGLISVYSKHYFANLPQNIIKRYTFRDLIKNDSIKKQKNKFEKNGKLEIESIKKVKHIIGRTDWDNACTNLINQSAKYYFCNETLRDSFYKVNWNINKCNKYSIFVSQSNYPIKGFHHVLEAMPYIIKKYPNAHIYTTGTSPLKKSKCIDIIKMSSYEKYIRDLIISNKLENYVTFLGKLDEKEMCMQFLKSHVFISPSSIENSPNSVGEAMILGVPTITSDVGGVKNLINHEEEGFIYQHDAPYMIPYYVSKIFDNDKNTVSISQKAIKRANVTHNRKLNLDNLIKIYNEISVK